ncbi:uncharacterized protein LOC143184644 [Calliopsis andreniformis]|uniref:uncharacterized protein LOC143184644 n=1 Tax=Calliopsis andreniformis TaxID=337506 RepID=UPI003FCEDD48
MENQAFEEEQQQPRLDETFLQQPSPRLHPFPPSRIELLDVPVSDGHVYEDILPGIEDLPNLSNTPFAESPPIQQTVLNYISHESPKSLGTVESPVFRRNRTLPLRRGVGYDRSATSSSVRVTSREKNAREEEHAEVANDGSEPLEACPGEPKASTQSGSQAELRPNRRRRKKDCKHCRNKANARICEEDRENEDVLRKNRENRRLYTLESTDPQTILDPCSLGTLARSSPGVTKKLKEPSNLSTVFTISEKVGNAPVNTLKLIDYKSNDAVGPRGMENEDKTLITPEKSRAGMRVNSIYSQNRWYAKEAAMFFTDVKENGNFQRAYSLPSRTQSPSSQNRVNLRRSVRGEPAPYPARLHKHRHGWTLHLARPLERSRCSRCHILLVILVLALLGIAAVALYIVFEPEKLQIIQQYLKSSSSTNSSHENTLSAGTFLSSLNSNQGNDTSTSTASTTMSSTLITSVLLNSDHSFPENSTSASTIQEMETETTSFNSTRYCDDCLAGEVCVALVDEEVPTCRIGIDREDPTGCAGFCLINKQKCHRLDVDAFRCVEIEHYCLDDEWTCSNTLCIPLEKRCDGHMNCYDHSDEYNCDCDLETHFECGNQTSCLSLEKRCDGKIDCWDAADEINCTLGGNLGWSCPSENEFTCSNGQCILKARFCDGLPDCLDGSDEPHGCQGRCNKHEFTCQNTRCIAKGMKCNGVDDCGDGTDERHCKDRSS